MNGSREVSKSAKDIRVVPIAEQHIEGFHQCLDSVARERRYLGFLEAPPLESTRQFAQSNIASGVPQFVALDGERAIIGAPGNSRGFVPGYADVRSGRDGSLIAHIVGNGAADQ